MITPTLKPGVLSLGDLFTATWNTYRAKFRLFVTLAAVPALLLGALFLLYMGGISALRSFTGEFESVLPVLLAGGPCSWSAPSWGLCTSTDASP